MKKAASIKEAAFSLLIKSIFTLEQQSRGSAH